VPLFDLWQAAQFLIKISSPFALRDCAAEMTGSRNSGRALRQKRLNPKQNIETDRLSQ
jgi:hypothetical protein